MDSCRSLSEGIKTFIALKHYFPGAVAPSHHAPAQLQSILIVKPITEGQIHYIIEESVIDLRCYQTGNANVNETRQMVLAILIL